MKRFLASFLAVIIVFIVLAASAPTKPPLRLLQTIPLRDLKAGDFDHFAADLAGNRLFLTGEATNAELVMDLRTIKLIHGRKTNILVLKSSDLTSLVHDMKTK